MVKNVIGGALVAVCIWFILGGLIYSYTGDQSDLDCGWTHVATPTIENGKLTAKLFDFTGDSECE